MGALCVYEIPLLINMSSRGVEHPWSVEQGAEARGSPVSHRIPRKLHLPWVLITGKVSHPSMSSFLLQFFDVCDINHKFGIVDNSLINRIFL